MNLNRFKFGKFYAIAIFLILFCGCGWSTLWYMVEPEIIRLPTASITAEVWWTEYNNQGNINKYRSMQVRGRRPDSLIVLTVEIFAHDSTSYGKQFLETQFAIEKFLVDIDSVAQKMETPVFRDTVLDAHSVWGGRGWSMPARAILFGPIPVSWPMPRTIAGSFDLITKDPDTGDEMNRETIQFIAHRNIKSIFRDFWDGR